MVVVDTSSLCQIAVPYSLYVLNRLVVGREGIGYGGCFEFRGTKRQSEIMWIFQGAWQMVRHQLHGRPSVYTYCDASCVVVKLPGTRGPGGPAFFGFCFASPDSVAL